MKTNIVEIKVYNKEERSITIMQVEQLSDYVFRMLDNDSFDYRLNLGVEFETQLNNEGQHEIISIIKESDFITRRFFLTSQFKESEYRLLGDEIMKQGGFWQVDFGSMATINLPKDSELNLDEIFKRFDFKPMEIID